MRTQGARKAVGAAKLEVTEFSKGDGGNRKGKLEEVCCEGRRDTDL